MNNFKLLLYKLPIEIIHKILFLTYKPQKSVLLKDIRNYIEINHFLRNLYYKKFIITLKQPHNEDNHWLINDLYAFLNNGNALMYGYIDKFYDVFKRKDKLNNKKQIHKFLNNLDKNNVSTQINIFLAIMTINERNNYKNYCLNII